MSVSILRGKDEGYSNNAPIVKITHSLTRSDLVQYIKLYKEYQGNEALAIVLREAGIPVMGQAPVPAPLYYFVKVQNRADPLAGYKRHSTLTLACAEAKRLLDTDVSDGVWVKVFGSDNLNVPVKQFRKHIESL